MKVWYGYRCEQIDSVVDLLNGEQKQHTNWTKSDFVETWIIVVVKFHQWAFTFRPVFSWYDVLNVNHAHDIEQRY